MKKILTALIVFIMFQGAVFSETVYDDNYAENPNYLKGLEYLNSSQYSSAINEFKKALRTNPKDESALIGLSNAYNMRAQYYSRNAKDREKAASDIKSALFFNKYYRQGEAKQSTMQAAAQMEKNLKMLEPVLSPEETAKKAKMERIKGEFAASAYDYFKLLHNTSYTAEAAAALGDIFKIFNRPDKSIIFYQNALSAAPDNAENHLKLARVYEDMNDYASSLKEYTFALNSSAESEDILNSLERIWQKKTDESPNDAEAHANLGVIYQKEKRYNEALEQYQKASMLNPNNINTKINIGTLYQEQKKYAQAAAAYDDVLKLQGNNTDVLLYKAECLAALNRKEEAAAVYRTLLQINPNNTQAKTALFSLMKDSMSTEDMLSYLYQNLKNSPQNKDAYYEFAYELHKAGKIDDAIIYYNQAIKLDSSNVDAYVNLSQCYKQKKNYAQADAAIKKAAAIAPDNQLVKNQQLELKREYSSIIYNTAASAYQSGSYEAAIESYSKIQPETAESNIGIAASYQALGNNLKAIEYYKRAMELAPDNAEIPYYIAAIYADENNIEQASKYNNAALAKNPSGAKAAELAKYLISKQTEGLLEQAVKKYEEEDYFQASEMLDNIIKINPKDASAFYYRALCRDALKSWQKAISDYQTAVKLAPEMNIAYYSIAAAYDNMGNYKQAKAYYQKYIDAIADDNEYKQYAQARIKELK